MGFLSRELATQWGEGQLGLPLPRLRKPTDNAAGGGFILCGLLALLQEAARTRMLIEDGTNSRYLSQRLSRFACLIKQPCGQARKCRLFGSDPIGLS